MNHKTTNLHPKHNPVQVSNNFSAINCICQFVFLNALCTCLVIGAIALVMQNVLLIWAFPCWSHISHKHQSLLLYEIGQSEPAKGNAS